MHEIISRLKRNLSRTTPSKGEIAIHQVNHLKTEPVCPDALSTETCVQMDPNQERRHGRGRSLLHNIKGSYKYQGQLSKVKTNLVIKKTQTRI